MSASTKETRFLIEGVDEIPEAFVPVEAQQIVTHNGKHMSVQVGYDRLTRIIYRKNTILPERFHIYEMFLQDGKPKRV